MPKKLIEKSKQMEKEHTLFVVLLSTFLERIVPRSKRIVEKRFGLAGGSASTLEGIGKEYGITRERVRQILQSAYSFVKQRRDEEAFLEAAERIEAAIRARHGLMRDDELLAELADGDAKERGAILFFLECMKSVEGRRETDEYVRTVVLHPDFSEEKQSAVISAATSALNDSQKPLSQSELWKAVKKSLSLEQKEFFDYLAPSRLIEQNAFGFWGFANSAEIHPRGTREKAYLVLKMANTPLHFKEIAQRIDKSGLQKRGRKTHAQTVHNELIKDKKFVLVGRGLYALSDWGYRRGTVREVLDSILRSAKQPMTRDDILEEIFKIRNVKRSTVIINLNAFFEKIGKDAYTVKD